MSILQRLFSSFGRSGPDPREDLRPLWDAVVAEARRPEWYVAGVEDSASGRFDMVSAVLALVVLRMEKDGDLSRDTPRLTELFVADMDAQLREFGVGDVVMGKRIGKLMGATGGRINAYFGGLMGDDQGLCDAVRRNVTLREDADAGSIATGLRALADRLTRTSDDALLAGEIAA